MNNSSEKQPTTTSTTKKQKTKIKTLKAPPLECTNEEYSDLLNTATSLTKSEARSELIECARYGELDAVRALLEIWSPDTKIGSDYVNTIDKNGTTALHKSAASGHENTVQLLLFRGARHFANASGKNTPLHWAAANGHENVVEMILNHDFGPDFELDVLAKNDGGRSALTEGFSSKKTKIVGMLLEHDSAAEEKLLMGGKEVDAKDADSEMKNSEEANLNSSGVDKEKNAAKHGVTHEFDFLRDGTEDETDESAAAAAAAAASNANSLLGTDSGEKEEPKTLLIRELPIKDADNPFDEGGGKLDTTGLGIWSASLVMARWMAVKASFGRFDSKNVLELGAGCGVPGLALGMYSDANIVYITDYNEETIANLRYNIDINANRTSTKSREGKADWLERIKAASIDWADESTWPKEKMDYVIGSDLIYQKSIVPLLKKVVNGLIKDDGSFLYTCPSDGRDGLKEFIKTMKSEGFRCVSEESAPDVYRSNPLSSGDDEDAYLHFHDLAVTEYKLYEFKKRI